MTDTEWFLFVDKQNFLLGAAPEMKHGFITLTFVIERGESRFVCEVITTYP